MVVRIGSVFLRHSARGAIRKLSGVKNWPDSVYIICPNNHSIGRYLLNGRQLLGTSFRLGLYGRTPREPPVLYDTNDVAVLLRRTYRVAGRERGGLAVPSVRTPRPAHAQLAVRRTTLSTTLKTMSDISKEELRKEITAILKDADLTTMSAKKVRQQIEEKLDIDLTERKKEVDDLVIECLQEKNETKKSKNKKAASEESDNGEAEEEEEEEEESEEEEKKKPAKRGAPKKTATKRKKGSSDEEESGSEEDASDEEYSPKKAKPAPKKGKAGKKGKKKGSDSDSDEDWTKNKKSTGTAKKAGGGGGKGKGSGYIRQITLSPELAAIVGCEKMARHEVVKKIWEIIKEKNLYDPKNKQYAFCDDDLMKVIGVKRFRTFGMMKYLKNHFLD